MLTIKREKKEVDADISYTVFVNDINMCPLENGEIKNFDLKNGDYQIQIKSSRFVSPKISFSIVAGTHIEFICKPSYQNNKASIFSHRVFKHNIGISLELKQDIYL